MLLVHGSHAPGGTDATGWLLVGLLVLVPSIAYLGAARARRAAGRDWPVRRAACFIFGLVLVAVAVSPGMHALGQHDPRGHMIQHLLLGMFAPLALVLAAPVTLLLGVLPVPGRGTARRLLRSRALHCLAHPATAGVLDMGGLYLLYLTPLYTSTTTNTLTHHVVNLHFLLAGYLFTWSIAGPDPAPRRPTITFRALVLTAAGTAHAYLAKLLYTRAPEPPHGNPHDLGQVQAAAQLMYYGGDLAELALAVALFATWYRTGRAGRRNPHRGSWSRPRGFRSWAESPIRGNPSHKMLMSVLGRMSESERPHPNPRKAAEGYRLRVPRGRRPCRSCRLWWRHGLLRLHGDSLRRLAAVSRLP